MQEDIVKDAWCKYCGLTCGNQGLGFRVLSNLLGAVTKWAIRPADPK